MQGRRRETRFLMSPPWSGALHTLEDVVVERVAEKDIWVLSSTPANRDESLVLELPENGTMAEIKVRVAESRPVVVGERLQHRVRLQLENGQPSPPGDATPDADHEPR